MAARSQGKTGDWSHPAVYRAASGFEHELRTSSYKQHRKHWDWCLDREMRKGWLLGVPRPMHALANDPTTRGPTEEERQRLADLRNNIAPAPPMEPMA